LKDQNDAKIMQKTLQIVTLVFSSSKIVKQSSLFEKKKSFEAYSKEPKSADLIQSEASWKLSTTFDWLMPS